MVSDEKNISVSTRCFGVSFAIAFPTVLTAGYFILFAGSDLQQAVYGVGKVIQFGFPAAWAYFALREKVTWPRWNSRGVTTGLAFGAAILLVMMVLYNFVLAPAGVFDQANEKILAKIGEMGVATTWKFIALGTFYALVHSLMEEYYWRWFVFRQLRELMNAKWAIFISSVGFMSHHVILLSVFFGWTHW
ncbi:MAG: membrane protease YdiL (CAAX protease family), partial [Pirellulaceae bacterium]